MKSLYPPIKPFASGRLKVSSIHELYYEQCGNPEGQPAIFLHGGPLPAERPGLAASIYGPDSLR